MQRLRPRSTLFPYTTLFRARQVGDRQREREQPVVVVGGHERRRERRHGERAEQPERELDGQRALELRLLVGRSEEHTSELQSRQYLVCRLMLEKNNN